MSAYDLTAATEPDDDEPWVSPRTFHGGGCYKPGNVHPLPVMLGPDWHWLADVPNHWLIVLHKSGLWIRVDGDFLYGTAGHPMDPEMFAIGRRLRKGVTLMCTGLHLLTVGRSDDGLRTTVTLEKAP